MPAARGKRQSRKLKVKINAETQRHRERMNMLNSLMCTMRSFDCVTRGLRVGRKGITSLRMAISLWWVVRWQGRQEVARIGNVGRIEVSSPIKSYGISPKGGG